MNAYQIIEMLSLQDRFNRRVNPKWGMAGYSWERAVFIECAELIEHVGWKWWKEQKLDRAQAVLEVVDVWHFVLSSVLQHHSCNVQKAANYILDEWNKPNNMELQIGSQVVSLADVPLARRIEVFGAVGVLAGDFPLVLFRSILDGLDITDEELFTTYLGKNALNDFRQANGYKEGTYVKVWNGREDNEVLAEIMTEARSYEGVMAHLAVEYAKATSVA